MSDKTAHVVLLSSDEVLATAVERQRPPAARLAVRPSAPLPADLLAANPCCWVDLDTAQDAQLPPGFRYVYFHSADRPAAPALPPGIFVRKPCHEQALQSLWDEVQRRQAAAPPSQPAATLPGWVAEFVQPTLPEVTHAAAGRLPAALGYRYFSIYATDGADRRLVLAESNHEHPVALTVELAGAPATLMARVAETRQLLLTADAPAAARAYGLPPPADERDYPDGHCLIAPLVHADQLCGLVNLSSRATTAVDLPDHATLVGAFDVLARAFALAQSADRARAEARVDPLTGLLNRRAAEETLEQEIRRSQRFGSPLAVIMIDLDGLKAINDSNGHAAGDRLLRHVAGQIAAPLRRFDAAARTGGDEFVVVLPSTAAPSATHVAERILAAVRADAAIYGEKPLPITASMGIAQWQPGWDATKLLDVADEAMYAAKRSGRDNLMLSLVPADGRAVHRGIKLPTTRATLQPTPPRR